MPTKKKKCQGFTLVELLVVIAIIGLLAGLAIVALGTARAKARDGRRISDIRQIQTALEMYFADFGGYPTAPAAGALEGRCISAGGLEIACSGTTYMSRVPSNPTPRGDGPCPNDFRYTYGTTGGTPFTTYQIHYCLGAAMGEIGAGFHNATPRTIADP